MRHTAANELAEPVRGPGRPRDQGIGVRVRAAAREEVAERGIADVTLASIARRAGVAKSTVYLRWPSVLDLLAEAAIEIADYDPVPETRSLRDELNELASRILRTSVTPPMLELHLQFIAMDAGAPQTYRRFQETAMPIGLKRAGALFENAIARGEIRADLDVPAVTRAFLGALLMEALMAPGHYVTDQARRALVDLFVDGLLAR